tara:strand:- start:409 stop:531 length:123 start_codon:yes stop_codon:yes gene_type:complete
MYQITSQFILQSEDLKVKYVDFGADSPGEWKVVDFGQGCN